MEIFTDVSGEVILKKYLPVGEMAQLAQAYAETLVSLTGHSAAVCDTEQIIAAAGAIGGGILHKGIAQQLDELIASRRSFITSADSTVLVCKDPPAAALAVYPIVSSGDVMGAIMLIKGEKAPARLSREAAESAKAAAMFISRQLD